ncbi:MAG: DUF5320 domain-containing protein [Bacteroidetes bacterium]|nr:DUF5320 domain-containing protein [Bacteroidota bacterium]
MPAGDRSGPLGQGPGTGRAFGYCYGFDSPGYTKGSGRGMGRGFGNGRGMGWGRGFGRGWGYNPSFRQPAYMPRNQWTPEMSREEEMKFLKSEADALKRSQNEIGKRLEELEKKE